MNERAGTGRRITFTYRFGIDEEVSCEVTVRQICRELSGYGIECISHTKRVPQKSRRYPLFWAYNIASDIHDVASGNDLPVREWLARNLDVDPLDFSITWRRNQDRYLQLIANFVDGYAQGWFFAVGECFRDQLDIRYTEFIQKNDIEKRWTQGPFYNFAEGHAIYDTPIAYKAETWSEALQHINVGVHVLRALQNDEGAKDDGTILVGSVDFALSVPNEDRTRLLKVRALSAKQNEFVDFLKTGVLRGQTVEQLLAESPEGEIGQDDLNE